jgi:hypothetical protein
MMHMFGKAAEYFGITVANHYDAEDDTQNEQGQRLKAIEKSNIFSPELIADYRKGDFQEKESRCDSQFVERLPLFECAKGIVRGISSILGCIEALSRAVATVRAEYFLDSVVSCRSNTFVPFLVLWLRFVLRSRTLCINTAV